MESERKALYTFDKKFHPKKEVEFTKADKEDIAGKTHKLGHDFELQRTLCRMIYLIRTEKAYENEDISNKTLAEYFADHIDEQDLFESKSEHSNFGRNKLMIYRFLHSNYAYDERREEDDWATNFQVGQVVWSKKDLPDAKRPVIFESKTLDPTCPPIHNHVRLFVFFSHFKLMCHLKGNKVQGELHQQAVDGPPHSRAQGCGADARR